MEEYLMQINPVSRIELAEMWPVESFLNAYKSIKARLSGASVLTLCNPKEINKQAILLVRLFIEDSQRLQTTQKYVLGLRFYSFGDMATIDIIALNKKYHREMASIHLKQMGWPSLDERLGAELFSDKETMITPCLLSGGFLRINDRDRLHFKDRSQDYGQEILSYNGNAVASFLASTIFKMKSTTAIGDGNNGNEPTTDNFIEGKKSVQAIMQMMLRHKNHSNFYEKICENIYTAIKKNAGKFPNSQQIGALMMMKVADRSLMEDQDFLSLILEELHSGFSRHIMLLGVVNKTQQKTVDEKIA